MPVPNNLSDAIRNLQTYLREISFYDSSIPRVPIDGLYDTDTRAAVLEFQRTRGLEASSNVDKETWDAIYDAYRGIVDTIPREFVEGNALPYGGVVLRIGAESEDVRILQQYLNYIATSFPTIPTVSVTGYFGPRTREAVIAFQELADIPIYPAN